ncbi:MAG: PEP/pyruvate-binding domain-containing protein [Chloroflexota bacterium]
MIYSFVDLPYNQQSAGGKGATLAKLFQAGYPVPDGIVITANAFESSQANKAGTSHLAPTAQSQLQAHLARLRQKQPAAAFAVRSSAVSEDSAQASFAGEFETVLDVQTDEEIEAAITAVYQSQHNERVAAYSAAQNIATSHQMAVVVQLLVRADYAGVLFTADPVTGSHSHMVGNFVQGLGEQLVSGEATPETFELARPSGRYEGAGALRKYGRSLYKLAQRLERDLGGPQDIEWAIAGGQLYLLQSRPITTMQPYNPATGEWNDSYRGQYLWTNANFGEAVPDVMTPMTWSLLQIYAREAFSLPLPGNHPFFGNIGGRFYMNGTLAHSMLKGLGFGQKRIDAETREFFGTLPRDIDMPLIPFSRWELIRGLLAFAPQAMRRVRRNRRELAEFTASVPEKTAVFHRQIPATHTKTDLLTLWQELLPFLTKAFQMLQAATGQFEDKIRPLRQQLAKLVGEADANALLSGFSRDDAQLASLGPVVGLWQVAQGKLSEADYRQQYGHRGAHEFELSWPRPAEDPDWLTQQQANLDDVDVPSLLAKQAVQRDTIWQKIVAQHPRRAKKLQAKLDDVAAAARGREGIRSELIRIIGVVRAFALQAGAVTGLGETVFFLRLEELEEVLAGGEVPLAERAVRQEAHERFSALPSYPALINGRFDPHQWAADPNRRHDYYDATADPQGLKDLGGLITGFPGAAGVVVGKVRRIDTPEDGYQLQAGEILVTTTTNIGWTPLFPKAAAIVTDVGAPLSHAAIVARELGIPAVVGCGNATMRLKTGDTVRVNGVLGTVEIIGD